MSSLVGSLTGLMTMIIPIVAIVGGISFAAYSMYLKIRKQRETLQMYHAERMAAIEKGIELPPLPPELLDDRYYGTDHHGEYRYRRWRGSSGLTLVLVGAAVSVALWQATGDKSFWWGLVIIAWGLGRLLSGHLDGGRVRYQGPPAGPPPSGNGGPLPPGSTFTR
jgi:Domain of unknown function (DUF6249)